MTRMQKGILNNERKVFIKYFGNGIVSSEIAYNHILSKYITDWPTFIYIENDTIRTIIEGVLPSSLAFQKMYMPK